MSKFKVGDRVQITHKLYTGCGLDVGTVHPIQEIDDRGYMRFKAVYPNGNIDFYGFWPDQVEALHHPTTLTHGQTYTSYRGDKWECIFVRDGIAWLAPITVSGNLQGAAHTFNLDGTPICLGLEPDYRIVFEPVREDTRTRLYYSTMDGGFINAKDGCIADVILEIPIIDGKFDCAQAKVTPCA